MEADVDVRDILEEENSVIIYAEPDQYPCSARSIQKCWNH